MSALMVSRIKVKDPAKLKQYLQDVQKVAAPYGAEMVFRGKRDKTIAGDDDNAMVVVVKFPDAASIDNLFSSEAYQPLVVLREEAAEMHMTSYETITA